MSVKDLIGSRRDLGFGVGLLATYGLLVAAAAATGSAWFFAVAAGLVLIAEVMIRRLPAALPLLGRLGITATHRHLGRDAAAVLFLFGQPEIGPRTAVIVAGLVAIGWAASLSAGGLAVVIKRSLALPVETRNIDLSSLPLPAQPPRHLLSFAGDKALYLNALVVPAAIATGFTGTAIPALTGAAVAAVLGVGLPLGLAPAVVRAWRAPSRQVMVSAVRECIQPAPTVLLHFAGPRKDAYQINMWLRTMEALDEPALVLLRERSSFQELARTRLPVLCVTNPVDLMNFSFESVRVALHPSNVGKNIHILREPGMAHVFIGHGDSDKVASINPYSKVYDEIWVAGRAGRDRYAEADVGVRDEEIVEVGRPQLDEILSAAAARPDDRPYTVLYAPTWEGWLDDPHATSLILLGERIITGLLAVSPAVRVWYRPHPLTGTRWQAAATAHQRLVELITRAGGVVGPPTAADLSQLGHHAFTGGQPALYDCFNQTDLLVSDVSSVISDWLASGKPYLVGDTRGWPEEEFRQTYPTTRAAHLLPPDGSNLEKVVELLRNGDDPMAPERRVLKEYLLGPDDPPALERFRAEVTRLCGAVRNRVAATKGAG